MTLLQSEVSLIVAALRTSAFTHSDDAKKLAKSPRIQIQFQETATRERELADRIERADASCIPVFA